MDYSWIRERGTELATSSKVSIRLNIINIIFK
jgi:hypothetical protein